MKFEEKIESILNEAIMNFYVDRVEIKDPKAVGKKKIKEIMKMRGPIGMEEWFGGVRQLVDSGAIELYDKKNNKLEYSSDS